MTASGRLLWLDGVNIGEGDLGQPPGLTSQRAWLALVGVGADEHPGLEKCGPHLSKALHALLLPAFRLPGRSPAKVVTETPAGSFSIGQNILVHAPWDRLERLQNQARARSKLAQRNKLRARHGAPQVEEPPADFASVLDSFPRIPAVESSWDLWYGFYSSLGHYAVVAPASLPGFVERLTAACDQHGVELTQISNAGLVPNW